jgi:hypothetical protein
MTDSGPGSSRRAQDDHAVAFAAVHTLAAELTALEIDPKDNPVRAALDAITFRNVDLEQARADLAQALALLDGRHAIRLTLAGPGHGRWHGDILVGGFDTASIADEIGRVLAQALATHAGVRVDVALVELPRQPRRGGPVSAGSVVIVGEGGPVNLMDRTARWPTGERFGHQVADQHRRRQT